MVNPVELLEQTALALHPLLSQLVFVGGATVPLLLTDPAAAPVRFTRDVDVATRVEKRGDLARLEEKVVALGFQPDPDGPICRWTKAELVVDLMTDDAELQGFTNPWYRSAIKHAQEFMLPSGIRIRLLDAVHLVATKPVAWRSRGDGDMFSHDLEDILLVLDGRPELGTELGAASSDVRTFIQAEFTALLAHPDFEETLEGTFGNPERVSLLLERLRTLTRVR